MKDSRAAKAFYLFPFYAALSFPPPGFPVLALNDETLFGR